MSELGKISYLSYWKFKIYKSVHDRIDGNIENIRSVDISIEEISSETAINVNDIASTMQWANMFHRSGKE